MSVFDSDDEVTFVPPDHFICPITFEVMQDPVICADGITYERAEITKWLEKHSTSPKTKDVLPNKTLIPNLALKAAIDKMKREHPNWESLDKEHEHEPKQSEADTSDTAIKIYIKTLSKQTWPMKADKKDHISDIKARLSDLEGIRPCQMRLIYAGKLLDDGRTLGEYNVSNNCTLHLVLRCNGG